MTKIKVNATKGGAVANKKIELEIVKVIDNPMAELASLDEREKGIVDVVVCTHIISVHHLGIT